MYPSNERKNIISICAQTPPPPKKEHQIRKKLARGVTEKYSQGRLLCVDFDVLLLFANRLLE